MDAPLGVAVPASHGVAADHKKYRLIWHAMQFYPDLFSSKETFNCRNCKNFVISFVVLICNGQDSEE